MIVGTLHVNYKLSYGFSSSSKKQYHALRCSEDNSFLVTLPSWWTAPDHDTYHLASATKTDEQHAVIKKIFGPANTFEAECAFLLYQYSQIVVPPQVKRSGPATPCRVVKKPKDSDIIVSIDCATCQDIDDALSYSQDGAVTVYISDVAHWVADRDLRPLRSATLYSLTGEQIDIWPKKLARCWFSLQAGQDRLALAFKLTFDSAFNLQGMTVEQKSIKVTRNLTYDSVDAMLDGKKGRSSGLRRVVQSLANVAARYNKKERVANSQELVETFMLLVNKLCGQKCAEAGIPVMLKTETAYEPYVSGNKYFHSGIGCTFYAQVTSPIRRIVDAINQTFVKRLHSIPQKASVLDEKPDVEKLNEEMRNIKRFHRKMDFLQTKYCKIKKGQVYKCERRNDDYLWFPDLQLMYSYPDQQEIARGTFHILKNGSLNFQKKS